MEDEMEKSDNRGLLATVVLLLVLFFVGYYSEKNEENSIADRNVEDGLSAITENLEE